MTNPNDPRVIEVILKDGEFFLILIDYILSHKDIVEKFFLSGSDENSEIIMLMILRSEIFEYERGKSSVLGSSILEYPSDGKQSFFSGKEMYPKGGVISRLRDTCFSEANGDYVNTGKAGVVMLHSEKRFSNFISLFNIIGSGPAEDKKSEVVGDIIELIQYIGRYEKSACKITVDICEAIEELNAIYDSLLEHNVSIERFHAFYFAERGKLVSYNSIKHICEINPIIRSTYNVLDRGLSWFRNIV